MSLENSALIIDQRLPAVGDANPVHQQVLCSYPTRPMNRHPRLRKRRTMTNGNCKRNPNPPRRNYGSFWHTT
jgi:hypothetical protein